MRIIESKCRYYGHSATVVVNGLGNVGHLVLIPTGGNQCAKATSGHAPCAMEAADNAKPEWDSCQYHNPEALEKAAAASGR